MCHFSYIKKIICILTATASNLCIKFRRFYTRQFIFKSKQEYLSVRYYVKQRDIHEKKENWNSVSTWPVVLNLGCRIGASEEPIKLWCPSPCMWTFVKLQCKEHWNKHIVGQDRQHREDETFSRSKLSIIFCKGSRSKIILVFMGHEALVRTIQLYCCMQAAINNTKTNG